MALLVRGVGRASLALVAARVGDEVSLLGPLGNAFPEPPPTSWAVVGGVGSAALGGYASAGMRFLFGARTSADAGFARALTEAGAHPAVATDDGSMGMRGTVVDLLQRELENTRPSAIYTCGSTGMMAAVARVARQAALPCWVSLEARMACGFGVCRGCVHPDASGRWRCICEDGPVYAAETIFAS